VDRIWSICAAVRRNAASAAVSASSPMRTSITRTTSCSVTTSASVIRNADRAPSRVTNAPLPCRVTTSPSARRLLIASRTTVRLTP
jgi:hypothetical protein